MKYTISLILCLLLLSACQTDTSKEIVAATLLETSQSWNGNPIPEIVGQPKVTISRVIIPPQKELPKHIHPVITTGILEKGELTITTEKNEQITIKAGDVLVEVSNTIHYGKNTGTTDAKILVFYIGGENTPVTILPEK